MKNLRLYILVTLTKVVENILKALINSSMAATIKSLCMHCLHYLPKEKFYLTISVLLFLLVL